MTTADSEAPTRNVVEKKTAFRADHDTTCLLCVVIVVVYQSSRVSAGRVFVPRLVETGPLLSLARRRTVNLRRTTTTTTTAVRTTRPRKPSISTVPTFDFPADGIARTFAGRALELPLHEPPVVERSVQHVLADVRQRRVRLSRARRGAGDPL